MLTSNRLLRVRHLALAAATVAAGLLPGWSGTAALADTATTYTPSSYGVGPVGPDASVDQWNVINTDAATGRVTLARAYPIPGTFSCAGAGPYANWTVSHPVTGAVSSVTVNLANAVIDDFTFVRIALEDVDANGNAAAIGFREIQGPIVTLAQSVELTAASNAFWQQPAAGHTLRVTFGLNESSACLPAQNADAGTADFVSVSVG
jgi:hypothetical protein